MIKTIFVDTETTGFDAQKNATIQLAAILDVDGHEMARFDISIKPFEGAVIEESALKVSGNTLESIAEFTPESVAVSKLVDWLDLAEETIASGLANFSGYNTPFDARFVAALFARNGREFGEFFHPLTKEFDVLETARRRIGKNLVANHRLGTIALYALGSEAMEKFTATNGLHNAMTDIDVTRALFHRLQESTVPTEIGERRAHSLAQYGRVVDPSDLRELPQAEFDVMHSAARQDWERMEARRIATANGWPSAEPAEVVR